jgi:NAD(P)-dependent dehydrogenase (short-subunit alcohol dehydrogenase family)
VTIRRLAIVTGANGRIGSAIAKRLYADGFAVAMVVHRNREAADAIVHGSGGTTEDLFVVECDMNNPREVRELLNSDPLAKVQVSALVNNHGVMSRSPFLEVTETDFDIVMNTNLRSTYFLMQGAAQRMVQAGGGSIVNIASAAVALPSLNLGAYTVSKAGMLMLTRVAAQELGAHKIRVNAVSPGLIPTAMSDDAYRDPDAAAARRNVLAIGRFGEPRDIANAVAFLVSDEAGYMTGQNLIVDGGAHDNFLKPLSTENSIQQTPDGR